MNEARFQAWYKTTQSRHDPASNLLEDAFKEARDRYSIDFTADARKVAYVSSTQSLAEVQQELHRSLTVFQAQRSSSKAWVWLEKLSYRIHHYGSILDVLAQHHPEYVALAWGSIKLLLTGVINHEKSAAMLAKSLTEIADLLPQVELRSALYPTTRMKASMINLFTHLLRFLVRAKDWFEESKLKHLVHSITRPVELRYEDILQQIAYHSGVIKDLAIAGHQAEFRDVHDKIEQMLATVTNQRAEIEHVHGAVKQIMVLLDKVNTAVTLHSGALIDTNQRVSDLQFSQIMTTLVSVPIWDPLKAFQYHLTMTRRRSRSAGSGSLSERFWDSPNLRTWSSSAESALSVVVSSFQTRFAVREFCVGVIQQLHDAQIPILLALKVPNNGTHDDVSSIDLLKYLVRQAVLLCQKVQMEKTTALKCATFHEATTEIDWFRLLESALMEINRPVYIIVDFDIVDEKLQDNNAFSWISAFEQICNAFTLRGLGTKIKVLAVHRSTSPFSSTVEDHRKYIIPMRAQQSFPRQRRVRGYSKVSKYSLHHQRLLR